MPKLPSNLVKAPSFDSPLRRTDLLLVVEEAEPADTQGRETSPTAAASAPAASVPAEKPRAPRAARTARRGLQAEPPPEISEAPEDAEDAAAADLLYRLTVRLSQRQWEVLQTECFQQRIRGKKTNAANLIRDILDEWIARQGT